MLELGLHQPRMCQHCFEACCRAVTANAFGQGEAAPAAQWLGRPAGVVIGEFFSDTAPSALGVFRREFALVWQRDVQRVLMRAASRSQPPAQFFSLHVMPHRYGPSLADVLASDRGAANCTVPLYLCDNGQKMNEPLLRNGLWLMVLGTTPLVLWLYTRKRYGFPDALVVEVLTTTDKAGRKETARLFRQIDTARGKRSCLRGKIVTLTPLQPFSDRSYRCDVTRKRARTTELPGVPLEALTPLLEYVDALTVRRGGLRKLGMPLKKTLLVYGPAGAGMQEYFTWFASRPSPYTVMRLSPASASLVSDYFMVAKRLQPAMILVENVDRWWPESTGRMVTPGYGPALLDELNALTDDDDCLVILTTERLECAQLLELTRTGRIDRLVEIGRLDTASRRRWITWQAQGIPLAPAALERLVTETAQIGLAGIRSLITGVALVYLRGEPGAPIQVEQVDALLQAMAAGGTVGDCLSRGACQTAPTPV